MLTPGAGRAGTGGLSSSFPDPFSEFKFFQIYPIEDVRNGDSKRYGKQRGKGLNAGSGSFCQRRGLLPGWKIGEIQETHHGPECEHSGNHGYHCRNGYDMSGHYDPVRPEGTPDPDGKGPDKTGQRQCTALLQNEVPHQQPERSAQRCPEQGAHRNIKQNGKCPCRRKAPNQHGPELLYLHGFRCFECPASSIP